MPRHKQGTRATPRPKEARRQGSTRYLPATRLPSVKGYQSRRSPTYRSRGLQYTQDLRLGASEARGKDHLHKTWGENTSLRVRQPHYTSGCDTSQASTYYHQGTSKALNKGARARYTVLLNKSLQGRRRHSKEQI
jgi:hypothetical protein